jgi:DNA polymerase V
MRERRETSGFPSPAEDHIEETLDLQQLLIKRPAATFYLEMTGNAMRGLGIYDHDVLVVDRSLTPTLNSIVVIVLDGELLVRRWCPQPGPERRLLLVAAHSAYPVLEVTPEMSCEVWGVVTAAVRRGL